MYFQISTDLYSIIVRREDVLRQVRYDGLTGLGQPGVLRPNQLVQDCLGLNLTIFRSCKEHFIFL